MTSVQQEISDTRYHYSYSYCRGYRPGYDAGGRLLPELPTKPFLKAACQYENKKSFLLSPMDSGDGFSSSGPMIFKITNGVRVGHGRYKQVFEGAITCDHVRFVSKELMALIYDPLYMSIADLPAVLGTPYTF